MLAGKRTPLGFTLIEMMVTLAVIVILLLMAVPSFTEFRNRSALRGAAEQAASFWNSARFEAAKRGQFVKVGVRSNLAGEFCLGAATTTDGEDATGCDCFTVNACNVAAFPQSQAEWRGITLSGTPTLGKADSGVAVIDQKRSALANSDQIGAITLIAPKSRYLYKVDFAVDQLGRGYLCGTKAATRQMSDYANKVCAQ